MTNVRDLEDYFIKYPNTVHGVHTIARRLRLEPGQVRTGMTNLRAKAKAGKAINVETIRRGKEWRYSPGVQPELVSSRSPAVKVRINEATLDVVATFDVVGSLEGDEGLVLRGHGTSFEGVWLAKRL